MESCGATMGSASVHPPTRVRDPLLRVELFDLRPRRSWRRLPLAEREPERHARALANRALVALKEMFGGQFSDRIFWNWDAPVCDWSLEMNSWVKAESDRGGSTCGVMGAVRERVLTCCRRALPVPGGVTRERALQRLAGERALDTGFILANDLEKRPERSRAWSSKGPGNRQIAPPSRGALWPMCVKHVELPPPGNTVIPMTSFCEEAAGFF